MSSPAHFTVFVLLSLFCLISAILAEPICTQARDWAYRAICQNVISINTTAIDQQLIRLANSSVFNLVLIEGGEINLSSSTLKPFVNMELLKIDGRNGSWYSNDRFEKSTIDSNAFVENKKLHRIWLDEINFPTVENLRGIFQPLFGRLTWMTLGYCSFSHTPSANVASYDPFQVFNEFTKLEYVVIRYSGLTTIPANVFKKSASSLNTLALMNNKISSIDRNAFKSLSKLASLQLNENQITSIETGTFDDLTSLRRLLLQNNSISQLPNILFAKSGSRLTELHIQHNKLTRIHPTTFKGLTKLEWLYLYDNEITSIEPGTFDDLQSIQLITLNNNRISHLPRNLFEKTWRPLQLLITNNPIRNLSAQNFTRATNANGTLTVSVSE